MTTRRDFLAAGAASLAALGTGQPLLGSPTPAIDPIPGPRPARALSILILGGTSFLGPHQIAYALGRGHSITTFTRGRTEPTVHRELFGQVEALIGDRADNLDALRGRSWDAVIDNSGNQAVWTRDSARLLQDRVGRYLYTSSTGAYYPYHGADIDEDTEVLRTIPEGMEDDGSAQFGVMKANSEDEAYAAFGPDRTLVVRPTYMLGPADRTERSAYWPERVSRGGRVLVPGQPDDPVQYADVRDVAAFMIRLLEDEASGTYNAAGPLSATGVHRFVHGVHAVFPSQADFVAVDDHDFLSEHGVSFQIPWILPRDEYYGTARVSIDKGVAAGLTYRPLADTIRDVHAWWHSDAVPEERRERLVGAERSLMAREAEILEAWARTR